MWFNNKLILIRKMSPPGFEPGFPESQSEVLTKLDYSNILVSNGFNFNEVYPNLKKFIII